MRKTKKSRFQKLEKLGEGTYGVVFKAKDLDTHEVEISAPVGKIVALKKMRIENEEDGMPSTAIREIVILKLLRHRNIVSLKQVIHEAGKLVLVFEYLDYDLRNYMSVRKTQLQEMVVKSF